jgi:uncharacterized protein
MGMFLLKLLSPRPTFPGDMTDQERKVMLEHVSHWRDLTNLGIAIAFGPVLDPKGVWGVAIIDVADEAEVRKLVMEDPVTKANLGKIEIYPMAPNSIARKQ